MATFKLSSPTDLDDYARMLEEARIYSQKCQKRLQKRYDIQSFDTCELADKQDALLFFKNGEVGLIARISFLGAYNLDEGSWQWSWHLPLFDEAHFEDLLDLKIYGEDNKLEDLTTKKLVCSPEKAESLCEFGNYLLHGLGVQKVKVDNLEYYLFIHRCQCLPKEDALGPTDKAWDYHQYVIKDYHVDCRKALQTWSWLLIPDDFKVIMMTKFGDIFLQNGKSQIYFLDTINGEFSIVSHSREEFEEMLTQKHFIYDCFMPECVQKAEEKNILLRRNQCYTFKEEPILGGRLDVENIQEMDALSHLNLSGKLHRSLNLLQG